MLDKGESALYRDRTLPRFCVIRGCKGCPPVRGDHSSSRPNAHAPVAELGPQQPQTRPIAVAVVDPDPGIHKLISEVCGYSDDFRWGGAFPTAAAALRALPESAVRIIFVAMGLPDLCGIRCVHELKGRTPAMATIITSVSRHSALVWRAAAAGVDDFLIRPLQPGQCLATLRFVWCRLHTSACSGRGSTADFVAGPTLKPREEQILFHLERGLLYKEVEDALKISHTTMKRLEVRLYRKLHVHNRMEAVTAWRKITHAIKSGGGTQAG